MKKCDDDDNVSLALLVLFVCLPYSVFCSLLYLSINSRWP